MRRTIAVKAEISKCRDVRYKRHLTSFKRLVAILNGHVPTIRVIFSLLIEGTSGRQHYLDESLYKFHEGLLPASVWNCAGSDPLM